MSGSGFFDLRDKLTGKPTPASQAISPSDLNRLVERALRSNLPASLLVRGELSNFSKHRSSGHFYFTLKDAGGAVDCVMFAGRASTVRFTPADGMEVQAGGSVSVYVPRGRYQLYVSTLEPVGVGSLELARKQIEEKLRREGLFEPERKSPLPTFAERVAIVSSPQAAGFADMLKVLRRCPWIELFVVDVPVQGAAAAPKITAAIRSISKSHKKLQIDVVLLARGGGSLEDLWAFNDESLARAIADCPVPVVTGIGHETDVSIADLVADHHAHTPTEAATTIVRPWLAAADELDTLAIRLRREVRLALESARSRLRSAATHPLLRRPTRVVEQASQRIDEIEKRLNDRAKSNLREIDQRLTRSADRLAASSPQRRVERLRLDVRRLELQLRRAAESVLKSKAARLESKSLQLEALSPDRILARGYSITRRKSDGRIIRNVGELKKGDRIVTKVRDGEFESRIDDPRQPTLF